jgi:broad specificity phosphatase PhoE
VKQLYLIRHCETKELAGEEPSHPRNDSMLSANGFEQAERLLEHLRPFRIDLFLTSIFERSVQTAVVLNRERNVPVFGSAMLNEYFLRDDFQGAETVDQGLVRSIGFLNQFRPFFDCIAVVGHNSILTTVLMSFLNMPFEDGKEIFNRAGTCRVLRYDWTLGDQNWREIDLFTP